jgi:hypothetical protein
MLAEGFSTKAGQAFSLFASCDAVNKRLSGRHARSLQSLPAALFRTLRIMPLYLSQASL